MRHLNQLNVTYFNSVRVSWIFDGSSWIFDWSSTVDLNVAFYMCRIKFINYVKLYFTHNSTVLPNLTCTEKTGGNFRRIMAAVENAMCGSCFASTKYICLSCTNAFCMRCSVFEEDEEKPRLEGWEKCSILWSLLSGKDGKGSRERSQWTGKWNRYHCVLSLKLWW